MEEKFYEKMLDSLALFSNRWKNVKKIGKSWKFWITKCVQNDVVRLPCFLLIAFEVIPILMLISNSIFFDQPISWGINLYVALELE